MASKNSRSQAASKNPGANAFNFIGDVKAELKKISWTTKEELQVYTKIVVVATFVFGMMIYLIDLVVNGCLGGIGTLFRMIIG